MSTKPTVSSVANRVESVEKSMKEFEDRLQSILTMQIKEIEPVSDIPMAALQELTKDFSKFKCDVNGTLNAIKSDLESIKADICHNTRKLDDLENYSRRNCLLLHGISESRNENVDQIVLNVLHKNLKLPNVSMNLIDRCHRLGPPKRTMADAVNEGKRPIIIKFTSYRVRNDVWKQKKLLKNTKLLLTESLSSMRQQCLLKAKEKHGHKNVWTQDGRIIILQGSGRKVSISNIEELDKLK